MENNKLIAEFMGRPFMIWNDPDPIEGNDYRVVYFKQLCDRTALIQYSLDYNGEYNSEAEVFLTELEDIELKYHTSWDWLMPVIDKCYQEHMSKHIAEATMTCDIDEAYKVVVEFINEYNNNNGNN